MTATHSPGNRRSGPSAAVRLAASLGVKPVSAKNLLTDPDTGLRFRTYKALEALRETEQADEVARWMAHFEAAALGQGPLLPSRDLLQPKAIADAGEDCARQAYLLNPNPVTALRLVNELWLEAGRAQVTARALEAEYGLRGA